MDTRLRKICNDLLIRKTRTVVTLLGLVVGFWGLGSVIIAHRVLSHDLSENFARTRPPHIVVEGERLAEVDLTEITALPGVRGAELRSSISARIEIVPDRWLPLMLFVIEDFDDLRVARFEPEEGEFPPPPGTMLIERDGRYLISFMRRVYARVDREGRHEPARRAELPADAWRVQLPGEVEVRSKISGTVFDPAQAPSRMDQIVYAYVGRETAEQWLPEGVPQRLLVESEPGHRQGPARAALVVAIRGRLEDRGATLGSVSLPPPDEHPHQFQMNSILFLLTVLGTSGFVLSAVLVINLISALLTNQIRQIGSLKAIGATAGQVAMLYLAAMFLLGLVAAVLTLPLAVASGFRLARIMAAMLNFELLTTGFAWWYYAAMVLIGALFPVLAAGLPVRRWSRVSVRGAMDNYGIASGEQKGSVIDRLPLPLPFSLRLGLRNALRRSRRFLLSVLTLGVGALVFMVAMNVRASLLHTATMEERTKRFDLSVSFEQPLRPDRVEWINQLDGVERVELWSTGRARMRTAPDKGGPDFPLLAVPADNRAFMPNLIEGRWVEPGRSGIVVSHRFLYYFPRLEIGDRLGVSIGGRDQELEVVGLIKVFGPAALYIDADAWRPLNPQPPDQGNVAFITLKPDGPSPFQINAILEQNFELAGISVRAIQVSRMAARVIRNHLVMIEAMLAVMALVMLIVSGLGLGSSIGTSVVERTREVGVLRAIGATPGTLYRVLGAEAVFMAAVAWLLALAIAAPLSRVVASYFGRGVVEYPFDYAGSVAGTLLSLVVLVAIAIVATWGPARMATRQSVVSAVSYE